MKNKDDFQDISAVEKVKIMIRQFEINDLLADLIYLQIRVAVGGITESELIAYRSIYNKIMQNVNEKILNKGMEVAFHVADTSKESAFKNKDMMILIEAITSESYKEVFGVKVATAIIEQDEYLLNNILKNHLPSSFGCKVIVELSGDARRDVDSLTELSSLLLKRNVREVANSQSKLLKIVKCNPWDEILKQSDVIDSNKLVVSYVDYSQENLLDIDLLQQVLYINGMLKKILNKKNQKLAVIKSRQNKMQLDAARVGMPIEQEVYNISPENILGESDVVNQKIIIEKDVVGKSKSRTGGSDVNQELDQDFSVKARGVSKAGIGFFQSVRDSLVAKSKVNKKKTDEDLKAEHLIERINLLNENYLTENIKKKKEVVFTGIIHPQYEKEAVGSIKNIRSIESILEASLTNPDSISHKDLSYSFIDVTAGISAKFNWKANNCDID